MTREFGLPRGKCRAHYVTLLLIL